MIEQHQTASAATDHVSGLNENLKNNNNNNSRIDNDTNNSSNNNNKNCIDESTNANNNQHSNHNSIGGNSCSKHTKGAARTLTECYLQLSTRLGCPKP